jgi:hypothetical protein
MTQTLITPTHYPDREPGGGQGLQGLWSASDRTAGCVLTGTSRLL